MGIYDDPDPDYDHCYSHRDPRSYDCRNYEFEGPRHWIAHDHADNRPPERPLIPMLLPGGRVVFHPDGSADATDYDEHEENTVTDYQTLQREAQGLISKMAAMAALESRFPSEPPVLTVLRWSQTFGHGRNAKEYSYAALRVDNGWFVTGTRENEVLTWPELKERLAKVDVEMAVDWKSIPVPQAQTVDQETDPKRWFELVYGDPNKTLAPGNGGAQSGGDR
jgi:hypothetical protein